MKWENASALRTNKTHKRLRQDTCSKCFEPLETWYVETKNGHKALKVLCNRCGVKYETS